MLIDLIEQYKSESDMHMSAWNGHESTSYASSVSFIFTQGLSISAQYNMTIPLDAPISNKNADVPAQARMVIIAVPAPANLQAGYTFEASHCGNVFGVKVPDGGVKKGDHILVSIPEASEDRGPISTEVPVVEPSIAKGTLAHSVATIEQVVAKDPRVADPSAAVPVGHWRYGFYDCSKRGFAEPTCCLAFWCNGIALGQVMTRLKLSSDAQPTTCFAKTFAIVSALWITYSVVNWIFYFVTRITFLKICDSPGCYNSLEMVHDASTFYVAFFASLLSIYFIYIGTATRMRMRKAFQIPGSCLADCCAFFWCSCCTVAQMAHHTHDPEVYKSSCCSKNGLRTGAPEIV